MQIAVARDGLAVGKIYSSGFPAGTILLPELPHGQSYGLRIGLARGFGDDALVVQRHIGAAPETMPHSRSDPKRIRHVVLVDPIDARLSTEIVISVRRR